MKHNLRTLILLTFLILLLISCENIDKKKFIANYKRDKFIPSDTLEVTRNRIDKSTNWIVRLKDNDVFEFIGSNKMITGEWTVERKDGDDIHLKFQFDGKSTEGRLNGNIIYFDKPNEIFDNIFDNVIFVKTIE